MLSNNAIHLATTLLCLPISYEVSAASPRKHTHPSTTTMSGLPLKKISFPNLFFLKIERVYHCKSRADDEQKTRREHMIDHETADLDDSCQ
jgi:hypothetical protein